MEGQNPCTRFKSKSMEVFWVFTQPRPKGDINAIEFFPMQSLQKEHL